MGCSICGRLHPTFMHRYSRTIGISYGGVNRAERRHGPIRAWIKKPYSHKAK